MKEKISSKLRLLLCFGVIVFISLVSPSTAEAHIPAVGGAAPGDVYDLYSPWDATHVGWFTHDKKVSGSARVTALSGRIARFRCRILRFLRIDDHSVLASAESID